MLPARYRRTAGIVVQDDEYVGSIFRRLGVEEGLPVRFGIAESRSMTPLNCRGMSGPPTLVRSHLASGCCRTLAPRDHRYGSTLRGAYSPPVRTCIENRRGLGEKYGARSEKVGRASTVEFGGSGKVWCGTAIPRSGQPSHRTEPTQGARRSSDHGPKRRSRDAPAPRHIVARADSYLPERRERLGRQVAVPTVRIDPSTVQWFSRRRDQPVAHSALTSRQLSSLCPAAPPRWSQCRSSSSASSPRKLASPRRHRPQAPPSTHAA